MGHHLLRLSARLDLVKQEPSLVTPFWSHPGGLGRALTVSLLRGESDGFLGLVARGVKWQGRAAASCWQVRSNAGLE
jgi:hypothetical protein